MEYGTIEREIHVDASPEVVFEVVSRPEHIAQWWSDAADFDPTPGAVGELVWGERAQVAPITVVDAQPPRLFSFRWCYPGDDVKADTALLITFELTPSDEGTTVRMTETGFREMGWTEAKLLETYNDHCSGWDTFIPRLADYIGGLVSAR
ncbi:MULTISPECIES: SRPBCC family protein [Actinokineospora]|uniref:Activator of HSP90 ATPase n=1 Tax=Actinokineospora fastidiosa TaxID=1816 RepID=A0A918GUE0_9PSEU|nr:MULTISPECIES: SRPBCC family protein [Actinokineospora]UVS78359.1 Activator of Hsp90 ATPase [Actinokineospora sp. UTMC 2448]GGS59285.1 activator of HSP90 ATPase [Actinokineospora fastidiosa]